MAVRVVVIGGGVAGCAAAAAAAKGGARVQLLEAGHHLGGVAVRGEHRTLCGLAAIDAPTPDLLEPQLVSEWLPRLTSGVAYRQGRVWLWPTDAQLLQSGLAQGLAQAGVSSAFGAEVCSIHRTQGRIVSVSAAAVDHPCDVVIDASGAGVVGHLLGLPRATARQWPAHRSLLDVPGLSDGRAERVRALTVVQRVRGGEAACALTPLEDGHWQLSLDVAPDVSAADGAKIAGRVADALGGTLIACAWRIAERDGGRPVSTLDLDELFSTSERGLCWAAWPREEHGAAGVIWTWPPRDRHGVPECVVRPAGWPTNAWCVGRGIAASAEAASALRVTGTCLALGGAVGARTSIAAR